MTRFCMHPAAAAALMICLSGCGEVLLDASSDEALMQSYFELKKQLTEREGAAFDLAFHKTRELVNAAPGEDARSNLREKYFAGRNVASLIRDFKVRLEEQVVDVSKSMQASVNCFRSYDEGLKLSNQHLKNSLVDPENRVEFSFDLNNNSSYPIRALQGDLTIQVFGAPDYERKYDGTNYVRCFATVSIPSGGYGHFTCNVRYKMGTVRFDAPAEDLQVFDFRIVNNDPDLQDGREEKNSMASCRAEMETHRSELKMLTDYMDQLRTYRVD